MFKKYIPAILATLLIAVFSVSSPAAQEVDEPNQTRERVLQRVNQIRQNPKAVLGTVTDKTETTLQVQPEKGNIQFISINGGTSYSRVDTKVSEIKYDDIGIGDFIAALGQKDANEVLVAKKILLSPRPETPKIKPFLCTVTDTGRNSIDITSNQEIYTVRIGTNTRLTTGPVDKPRTIRLTTVEEDDKCVVFGSVDGKTIDTRRVHILEDFNQPTDSPTL
jgi:hypothetical protein